MSSKEGLYFRAIKSNPTGRGAGEFTIEAGQGGHWSPGISGLSESEVQKTMLRLHSHGKVIVDTPDFKFEAPAAPEIEV